MVVVHIDRPFVETDGRTIALIGSPPNTVRANLMDHTVKWKAGLEYGVVSATAPLSWPLAVQALLGGKWDRGLKLGDELKRWLMSEIEGRLPDPDAKQVLDSPEYTQPEGKAPRPYQMEAAAMLSGVARGILWDDPGTGKTISAILGALRLRQRIPKLGRLPVLVVAPPSVVDSWVDAWHEWTSLRAVAWRGTSRQRHELAGLADVYVTGYTTIRNDAGLKSKPKHGESPFGPLLKLGAGILILDEVQAIKNPRAVQSLAARRLAMRATGLIELSGTPITHHIGDSWPSLNALDPIAWPSRERFTKRYMVKGEDESGYKEVIEGFIPEREPEFRATLTGQTRRVSKADVLDFLPPKVYSERIVELPKSHRDAYDQFERDMMAILPDGQELTTLDVVVVIQRLLQLSCASVADITYTTEMVTDKETGEPVEKVRTHVTLGEPSWKIDELVDVAAEREGRQGLVFAPSAQLVKLAAARMEAEGYAVGMIVGGQKAEERTQMVNAFQAGDLDIMCATTQSGGTGLTLTAASYVVFLQRPWSYGDSVQAEDRAHRIGSERHTSIEIIDIIAKDTVDTRVRDIIMGKSEHLANLVQDPRIMEQCLGNAWKTEKHQREKK